MDDWKATFQENDARERNCVIGFSSRGRVLNSKYVLIQKEKRLWNCACNNGTDYNELVRFFLTETA